MSGHRNNESFTAAVFELFWTFFVKLVKSSGLENLAINTYCLSGLFYMNQGYPSKLIVVVYVCVLC